MENLKKELLKISAGKVLDVGTGRGQFVHLLKNYLKDFDEIIGVDNFEPAINYCKDNFNDPKISFELMDAYKLDFEDETFDTVCLSNSIHHFPDYDKILKEMKRVLKPNGYFIVSEMYSDNQDDQQLSHVKVHHWSAKVDEAQGNYHAETLPRSQILDIVRGIELNSLYDFDFYYPANDPKSEKTIEYFDNVIDTVVERVNDKPEYEDLKAEGKEIKDWIKEHGFKNATELIIIGKK